MADIGPKAASGPSVTYEFKNGSLKAMTLSAAGSQADQVGTAEHAKELLERGASGK